MASKWFNEIIPMQDQYEVAKAKAELAVTATWFIRFFNGWLTRLIDHESADVGSHS